jgi:hypothetical protein
MLRSVTNSPPAMPTGGYRPKSKAGRIALAVFVAACVITVVVMFIVKG